MTSGEQEPHSQLAGVDAAAIDTARGKVGVAARTLLDNVRKFAERATALVSAPDALRESARQQIDILADQQAQAVVATRPITDLRGLAGKNARLGALADAGYRTVGHVVRVSPNRLQAVPGIGLQSAQQVSAAAHRLAREIRLETRVRFDPDQRHPGATQLLATLAAARHADSIRGALQEPLQQFTTQAARLVQEAEPTASRAGMLFRFGKRKRTALAALARLDALLAAPRTAGLLHTVGQQERAVDPASYAPDQLWLEYSQDAAGFNALLSTLGGQGDGDDGEAAQGFLPEELRQEITAVPLDTSLLKTTLRGYQVFGAQYAIHQKHSILGDEMGLGKTVQALATMTHMAAMGQARFLVVCPASVQINWLNEIRKHSTLTGHSLHGADRAVATHHWLRTGGVAVTTFTTLGRLHGIADAGIALLVVDEAHYVKNPESQRSQHVAAIVARAQRALFLTGTPMENRVEEFRNLVHYLQPRVARDLDVADAVTGAKRFRRAVAPVYLRRNQEDVLTELPDKIEVEDWVHFSESDIAAYTAAVRAKNLMQMRQAAFRPAGSAKLERLAEIVDEAREDGRKVVVFSYFLGVLQIIHSRLGQSVVGELTGSVQPVARQQLVDTFSKREGHAVLLSQIEAGGVGLNVQAASVVIIAEPQWKPSTEEQAIARAYRMGQIRKVQVHRLLAKGSVDERLREVQERKSLLFAEFARKSDAKDADLRSVDTSEHRPDFLDDEAIPLQQRIIRAEQLRLGIES
ncbi:Helicase conserved C-terminal domain-containing protein [Actinokineospora terrae]|uniref:Helicase conserved C-terminal domain-containing protein n=1 Tax=Actinokineospora terrae TaxID=155974 RepID=A0A1H9VZT6_9PSEU|nr:Helicase conserved C-terminal domain-containing protein [Actinokineospora terrae]